MYVKQLTEDIKSSLTASRPVWFDTETIGLYGRTRLVQVRQGEYSYVFDCYYVNIEELKYWLKPHHLVGHNIYYDLSCLNFRNWLPAKIDDTMLLARSQWPSLESHSLASLSKFLQLAEKTDEGASDWSRHALTEEQLKYAELDTWFVEQIYNKVDPKIFDSYYYQLDIKSMELALVYQNKGMPTDSKMIAQYIRDMKKGIRKSTLPPELNVSSSKQVTEFLGVESSDKATLVASTDPRAKEVLEQRHFHKALSYFEDIKNHKLVYSFFNPAGAKTGRFTSRGGEVLYDSCYFNLQQVPRDFKKVFGVKPPAMFVTADYPALEVWVCGAVVNDAFMCGVLRRRDDLHYSAAEKIFGLPRTEISKKQRAVAKSLNFTLMYGAGYNTLYNAFVMEGFPDEAEQAKELRQLWLSTYKDLAAKQQEVFNHFKAYNSMIVYTPLGKPLCARKPTEALNFSIQGGGVECTKLALWLLHKEGIIPVSTVHDSIALIANTEKEAEEYAQALKWSMEESYRRVIKNCPCNDLSFEVSVYKGEYYE